MEKAKPLGQLLLEAARLSDDDLTRALRFQADYGGRLGAVLVRLGICSEEVLLPVLAAQLDVAYSPHEPPPMADEVARALDALDMPAVWFENLGVVPWQDETGCLCLASRSPRDPLLMEILQERELGVVPEWRLIGTEAVTAWLELLHVQGEAADADNVAHLRELAEEAPVVALVNNILTQAVELGASDIHLEPERNVLRVRYRIDGVLVDRLRPPRARLEAVVSRIKLMADLDIAERRLPQDGRLSLHAAGKGVDVRVSTLPGAEGESLVMRLLPKEDAKLNLDLLGLAPDLYAQFSAVARQPHGLILVTGPTGSGKSTTLYALLGEINNGERKIITVEDPVEYHVDGVTQVQAHADIGYDFARALRAILRQDPDVIMIGEVRDAETARIAVQSSITGHAVLSTLHTNDALSAFDRMIDMGVEPFLLASALRGVLAQRLVRRVCPHCAERIPLPDAMAPLFSQLRQRFEDLMGPEPEMRSGVGCEHCLGTGYSGRVGIYEWVSVTPRMSHLIAQRASISAYAETLGGTGYRKLREDGLLKAWNGQTTLDEVFRVTGELEEDARHEMSVSEKG